MSYQNPGQPYISNLPIPERPNTPPLHCTAPEAPEDKTERPAEPGKPTVPQEGAEDPSKYGMEGHSNWKVSKGSGDKLPGHFDFKNGETMPMPQSPEY